MNQGIETLYGGILFRSKLETRWAAYFDLLGLSWKYETHRMDVFGEPGACKYLGNRHGGAGIIFPQLTGTQI